MENKRKVVFLRSTPVAPYPRLEKTAGSIADKYNIEILAWDREGGHKKVEVKPFGTIRRMYLKAEYGRWRFFLKLLLWQFYEFFWLLFHRFDIIHAYGLDTYWPAVVAVKLKGKKIVYDINDFYADMISDAVPKIVYNMIRKFDLHIIQYADAAIIADDSRREQIKGSKPKKLIVTYNAPDIDTKEIKNLPKNKKFTIFYGGLLAKKRGLNEIIKATEDMKDVQLIIGGYGPDEKYYKHKFQQTKNVKFLGKLDYDVLLAESKRSDMLFATYDPAVANHKYSSPNKLFEAMALSKPIIVNSGCSMTHIVEKEKCGLVVDYGNIEQLKTAIDKLKNSKTLRDQLGKNGNRAYANTYHWSKMKKRIISLYKKLI